MRGFSESDLGNWAVSVGVMFFEDGHVEVYIRKGGASSGSGERGKTGRRCTVVSRTVLDGEVTAT